MAQLADQSVAGYEESMKGLQTRELDDVEILRALFDRRRSLSWR